MNCLYCRNPLSESGECSQCDIKTTMIEVARSFSYKLNAGNYESRDFFCSQKAECEPADAEATSERLYQFCKQEVIKGIKDWKAFAASAEAKELKI